MINIMIKDLIIFHNVLSEPTQHLVKILTFSHSHCSFELMSPVSTDPIPKGPPIERDLKNL